MDLLKRAEELHHTLEPHYNCCQSTLIPFAEELGLEKHDPRCFQALSHTLGVEPGECTLLDDSPFNCATSAAACAGARCAGR